jgi:hypothetical protein
MPVRARRFALPEFAHQPNECALDRAVAVMERDCGASQVAFVWIRREIDRAELVELALERSQIG